MSSPGWSAYNAGPLHVAIPAQEISAAVVDRLNGLYRERLPLIPAVPNQDFPPDAEALLLTARVIDSIEQSTPELIERLGEGHHYVLDIPAGLLVTSLRLSISRLDQPALGASDRHAPNVVLTPATGS